MAAFAQRTSGPGGVLLALAACSFQAGFATSAWARTSRIEPIGSYVVAIISKPEEVAVASVQEMVQALRDGGLPVAAIAEMARVERKTVYAWLEGGDARPERASRLAEIHGLLIGGGVELHALWRMSGRSLSSGQNLRQILASEAIDAVSVRAALDELRPAIERQTRREAARIQPRPGARNPILDEMPIAELG